MYRVFIYHQKETRYTAKTDITHDDKEERLEGWDVPFSAQHMFRMYAEYQSGANGQGSI